MLDSILTYRPFRMVFISIFSLSIYLFIIYFVNLIYPKKKISYPILLLGFSILPIISVFREGVYESGDFTIHVTRTIEFYKSLSEGIIIPRWAADLNATYGYALFEFIYPLPYYISSIFHFLGFSFVNSVKALLITTYISSGFAMFYWLKLKVSLKYAFLGAIFYLYSPYHLVDLHFRSDVGEITAFLFIPLSFYFLDRYSTNYSFIWKILAALSVSFLILSHPAVSLLAFGLLALYIVFQNYKKGIKKLIDSLSVLVFGLGFSAFYWIPTIFEGKVTHQLYLPIEYLTFPAFEELVYSPWRFGFLFQGPQGELSFVLGYAQWIVLLIALYLLIFRKTKNNLLIFLVITFFLYLFIMQPISRPIWLTFGILRKMLLSYRVLAIIIFLNSAIAAIVASKVKSKIFYYSLIFIAIVSTILNWGNRGTIPEIKDGQITERIPYSSYFEEGFWPALHLSRPKNDFFQATIPENHIESLTGGIEILTENRSVNAHSYEIFAEKDSLIKENTYYFPGWSLFVNGEKEEINYENPIYPGIITFSLKEGKHIVELKFVNTSIRRNSLIITIFSLTLTGIYLIINPRFSKKEAALLEKAVFKD